jgi:serine/threonine-protein kinase
VFLEPTGLVSRRADGAGATERLVEGLAFAFDETADATLLVNTVGSSGDVDIGLLPLTGERTVSPLLATEYAEVAPHLSPDGRWLAYQSNESGRFEIYVRPYPDVDARRWQLSTDGGEFPEWAPDGSALYFIGPTHIMRAAVEDAPTFSWRPPEALIDHRAYTMRSAAGVPAGYGLSADGQRFLLIKPAATAPGTAASELIVLQDWLAELEQSAAAE